MPLPPKTQRGRTSRQRIVDAAATLIQVQGVRGTSLDQVLAGAGAGKGQLYHYFAGKEDLVRAVIEHACGTVIEAQMPELARLADWDDLAAWFDRLVALQVQAQCRGGCPLGSLASELADQSEDARRDLAGAFDVWESYLIEGFERMRLNGGLAPDAEPRRLATATLATVEGGLLLTQTRRDPDALRLALEAAGAYLRAHSGPGAGAGRA
jgi:TetR/AcrR family transcriptional regulator, transcriptional repressor for nem operon